MASDTIPEAAGRRSPGHESTTHHYATLHGQLRTRGTPIPTNDLWIAALALESDLALVTRDQHFAHIPQLVRID